MPNQGPELQNSRGLAGSRLPGFRPRLILVQRFSVTADSVGTALLETVMHFLVFLCVWFGLFWEGEEAFVVSKGHYSFCFI